MSIEDQGDFRSALLKKITDSMGNDYGSENDPIALLGLAPSFSRRFISNAKLFSWNLYLNKLWIWFFKTGWIDKIYKHNPSYVMGAFADKLDVLYSAIDLDSRTLLVEVFAYRLIGHKKIKLSFNNKELWSAAESAQLMCDKTDKIEIYEAYMQVQPSNFYKMDLSGLGYPLNLYFSPLSAVIMFGIEQYAYKRGKDTIVHAELGDVVLDCGGCWGDTALYFASKVGSKGKVYSFEFIPGNLKIHRINRELNPLLNERISVVEHPLEKKSGQNYYYLDAGPATRVIDKPFKGHEGSVTSLSIDDFVKKYGVERVDFIKMDIEGAELGALIGGIQTLKRFRPKLAISLYHNLEDFASIPRWILDLGLDYDLHLGHFTPSDGETVLFAKPKESSLC